MNLPPGGEFVTPAHLDAVRAEMHARIGQHEAEVHGVLKELAAKMDASRNASAVENTAVRGAIEHLSTQVGKLTKSVDHLEDNDAQTAAVHAAMEKFKGALFSRLKWATGTIIGFMAAAAGVLALFLG